MYMDKIEKDRFNKMYDMLAQIDKTCAVAAEQNKQIIKNIETLEKRQTAHEELTKNRHTENTTRLDLLKAFQDKQTISKKIWDKLFTGAIVVATWLISTYISWKH